jgi:hypothetical protein
MNEDTTTNWVVEFWRMQGITGFIADWACSMMMLIWMTRTWDRLIHTEPASVSRMPSHESTWR